MPAKKKPNAKPLTGEALIKETVRRVRVARSYWDAHNNRACRGEREKALVLYESLTEAEREKVPQVLRVWLRYRSEKYFGDERTPPGGGKKVTQTSSSISKPKPDSRPAMHERNRFRSGYDFERLMNASTSLSGFVKPNGHGQVSIDFADPQAVKALNQALLKDAYGLDHWDLPPGYLCPPIPGRCDYLHHLADLIQRRQGPQVRALDVGTGANCIYPLIGTCEFGWSFVGAELDEAAYLWAQKLVKSDARLAGLIELRRQSHASRCFHGMIGKAERYDLTMCNPPFHTSLKEAAAGTERKLRNLGVKKAALNFGGTAGELCCEGGELGFIQRMIQESVSYADQVGWFTTLVSKSEHLPALEKALRRVQASEVRIIDMAQGQKRSRVLAWRFGIAPF
jgi:23S rRNA (adenine1618-N6)-methyltransferase